MKPYSGGRKVIDDSDDDEVEEVKPSPKVAKKKVYGMIYSCYPLPFLVEATKR